MRKMPTKNYINRLDSTSEAVCFSFGMFFVRLLWPAIVDRRRIRAYSGSNSMSRTLFGDGRRWNNIKRCGQLFRQRRFIKEKNKTCANRIHRRTIGGFAEKFRNWQQSRWTRFGENCCECGPQQTCDTSLVPKCSGQTKEAHISRQTQRFVLMLVRTY